MSVHAGFWKIGSTPIVSDDLESIKRSMIELPKDGCKNAASSCSMREPDVRAFVPHRPATVLRADTWILAWDGRLDNRRILLAQLDIHDSDGMSDAEVAFHAYTRWQRQALGKFTGDWALVIVDWYRHTMLLARDFFGNRPLYYRQCWEGILWSSHLSVCADPRFGNVSFNEEFLRRFLAARSTVHLTPYKTVNAVPPGTVVTLSRDDSKSEPLWSPDLNAEIRYSSDDDYAEQFWYLFRQSVRDRLRGKKHIWAELSGGLDSSTIVCMIADLVRSGEVSGSLHTVSYVFADQYPEDERPWIRQVEAQIGKCGMHVTEESFSAFMLNEPNLYLERPIGFPGRPRHVANQMSALGAEILMRGHGGDAVMWSSPQYHPDITDHLKQGHLHAAHVAAKAYSLASMHTYWHLLWHEGLRPLFRGSFLKRTSFGPEWLIDSPLNSSPMPRRKTLNHDVPAHKQLAFSFLLDAVEITSQQAYQTSGVPEIGEPFMDRRLVQFMLSVPFDQKLRPGTSRWLHRKAVTGLLPGAIVDRTSKACGDGVIARAISREWNELRSLFDQNARVFTTGLISRAALLEELLRARHGVSTDSVTLLRAIAIEQWIRSIELQGESRAFHPPAFSMFLNHI
jgi:asparagine synthase (glutamine-hydrolysing)